MQSFQGIPASPGIAIGEVFLLEAEGVRIPEHFIEAGTAPGEVERLRTAMDEALDELHRFADEIRERAGSKIAEIFVAHAGMLGDEAFRREFFDRIMVKQYTAEFSVARTMRHWRQMFQSDGFLASRVADLDDLERRLLRRLLGQKREDLSALSEEVILVAHEMRPSQIASLDRDHVKAIATDGGGPTSHAAIIASALGLPAVVGLESLTGEVTGGDMMIVDGTRGVVVSEPDEKTLQQYRLRRERVVESARVLRAQLQDLPVDTVDGLHISLMANIKTPMDVRYAVEFGAEGIGLYRTEFLYLMREYPPTEEEHFEAYMETVNELGDRPIVIRTFDLGADKFNMSETVHEANPFLGLRSLRYCFSHPELLRVQLRAILRASAHGNVKTMFPLVGDVDELRRARAMLNEVRDGLDAKGIPFDHEMQVGAMVEVPSAAVHADALARECDFLSIGTNDLVQYTLAVDRGNEHVADLYRPEHPAVVRLIRMTVEGAHKAGIPVSVCGEMASALEYIVLLVGLGVDALSVAPPVMFAEIKRLIRALDARRAAELVDRVCAADGPDAAQKLLDEANRDLLRPSE